MKASLVGCATTVAALTAIVVAATFALGGNRTCAQSATGESIQTVAPDGGAAEAAAALERLARANFGELTEAEVKLLHAAPRRALVWVGPNSDADSPANDPIHAAKWLPTRTIRASAHRVAHRRPGGPPLCSSKRRRLRRRAHHGPARPLLPDTQLPVDDNELGDSSGRRLLIRASAWH